MTNSAARSYTFELTLYRTTDTGALTALRPVRFDSHSAMDSYRGTAMDQYSHIVHATYTAIRAA